MKRSKSSSIDTVHVFFSHKDKYLKDLTVNCAHPGATWPQLTSLLRDQHRHTEKVYNLCNFRQVAASV